MKCYDNLCFIIKVWAFLLIIFCASRKIAAMNHRALKFGRFLMESKDLTKGYRDLQEEDCVEKVFMTTELEYDDKVTCRHVNRRQCHTVHKTAFKQVKVPKCTTSYRRDCVIEYEKVPVQKKRKICTRGWKRLCDEKHWRRRNPKLENFYRQKIVCSIEPETICETTFKSDVLSETSPEGKSEDCGQGNRRRCNRVPNNARTHTECRTELRRICGFEICPLIEGDEECIEKVKTIVFEVPEESCELIPQERCEDVTHFLPRLEPKEECFSVPVEICDEAKSTPRKVQKPRIKKICGRDQQKRRRKKLRRTTS